DLCFVGDALEARLPSSELTDDERTPLLSISPLPNFGAAIDDEKGYLLLPDGPGALVRFKSVHATYVQNFAEEIYGLPTYTFVPKPTRDVRMPIFGIAYSDAQPAAVLGIVTQGDHHAQLEGSPAGYQMPVYRVYADFL